MQFLHIIVSEYHVLIQNLLPIMFS